jgi:DNA-binding transcriptional ArsR family regulator
MLGCLWAYAGGPLGGAVPLPAMDHDELLRILLEPARLAIVGAVALDARDADHVARETGVDRDEVLRTLAPFVQAGLVSREGARFRVDTAAWRNLARRLPRPAPPDPRIAFGMTEDEAAVLARFFSGTRLLELPAQRSKRLIVLERLALEFEPGRHYEEAQVNAVLQRFHDDHATLRRALVDEAFLDRAAGRYWRSGGRLPR